MEIEKEFIVSSRKEAITERGAISPEIPPETEQNETCLSEEFVRLYLKGIKKHPGKKRRCLSQDLNKFVSQQEVEDL